MAVSSPILLDFYPDKSMYTPGEQVKLILEFALDKDAAIGYVLELSHGADVLQIRKGEQLFSPGKNLLEFDFQPGASAPAGYGAEITLSGSIAAQLETAFDVLPDWTLFPRYGFLTDFSPARGDPEATIQELAKYHINGLQFYDWQYRHEHLVSPQENYLDPLGRPLSLKVIRNLIEAAHTRGIQAMPYLAIYAASAAFWKAHPDWALYDEQHQLIPFGEDFLGIMNPTAGSPWANHLLHECSQVLAELPFDGLHIDQYGEPKTGMDANSHSVDLPLAFADFIRSAVQQHPGSPVLFNAVENWPIEALAQAPLAFNYVEIWPPKTRYTDLVDIVRNDRSISPTKPVVVALYLPAERITNIRLADALIYSAGGSRIELGENNRLLVDPYFPKHEAISEPLRAFLRRQSDLIVRYEEWISPLIEEDLSAEVKLPQGVQGFFRHTPQGYSLSLVNLCSAAPLEWTQEHAVPEALQNFSIELDIPEDSLKISWVTPDEPTLHPQQLQYQKDGPKLSITVPRLEIWDVLLIQTSA